MITTNVFIKTLNKNIRVRVEPDGNTVNAVFSALMGELILLTYIGPSNEYFRYRDVYTDFFDVVYPDKAHVSTGEKIRRLGGMIAR